MAGPEEIASGRQDLSNALATLAPDQRAAVLLVDAYGLDYGEAAEVLGVRVGTIGSRLTRVTAPSSSISSEGGSRPRLATGDDGRAAAAGGRADPAPGIGRCF